MQCSHHVLQRPRLSASAIVTVPLPELAARAGVRVRDAPPDEGAVGMLKQEAGETVLWLADGWDEAVRDTIARYLIGRLLGVDLPPLPAELEVTEM